MTKMFGNLTDTGLEQSGDRLGGSGILDTGVYDGIVKLAYAGKSQSSNAQSITAHIEINGREFRESFWVTNRNGENFYADKNDAKKKHPLPGFTMADDLCLVTTGQPLAEQTVEEKVVNLYDFNARKEMPQNVPVLTDLIGKPVTVAIFAQIVDKNQKDANGIYQPTGETRNENVADKFFHQESHRTVTEIREGVEEAVFYDKWKEKNAGQPPRNRAKGVQGNSGAPGRPAAAGSPAAGGAARPSLFSK